MFLYIDETGNTGARFLDPEQPNFFAAALTTAIDFDIEHASDWQSLLASHGLNGLHATQIGPAGVEALSRDLREILDVANARFCVSRVEKIYALATNVHQLLFDPAENAASDWMFVADMKLRLWTAVEIAKMLRIKDIAIAFEACLFTLSNLDEMRQELAIACAGLATACDNKQANVAQLAIAKVAKWASKHPDNFTLRIKGPTGLGQHPNLICFSNLLQGAHRIYVEWQAQQCKIIHDRQHQYENAIRFWREIWSNAAPGAHILPGGEVRQYQALPGAKIRFEDSNLSPGLQAIDTCLWIINRAFKHKRLEAGARGLLELVLTRAELSDYSIEFAEKISA